MSPYFVSHNRNASNWLFRWLAGFRVKPRKRKGPAFCVYSDKPLIDVKFGVIVGVEGSRAIRPTEVSAVTLEDLRFRCKNQDLYNTRKSAQKP